MQKIELKIKKTKECEFIPLFVYIKFSPFNLKSFFGRKRRREFFKALFLEKDKFFYRIFISKKVIK